MSVTYCVSLPGLDNQERDVCQNEIICGAVTEEPHQALFRIPLTLGITMTTACSCEASFTDGSLHSLFVCLCVRVSCQYARRLCWRRNTVISGSE